MRWLHLRLCAPLGAFGGEAIDAYGVTRDFPARSMLAGLLANALGWRRAMREQHQALQDRLVFGAVQQRAPTRLTDYQTARLHQDDCSWSTRGAPIGRLPSPSYREGGPRGRQLTHQQWRDYLADLDTSLSSGSSATSTRSSATCAMRAGRPPQAGEREVKPGLRRCSKCRLHHFTPRAMRAPGCPRWA